MKTLAYFIRDRYEKRMKWTFFALILFFSLTLPLCAVAGSLRVVSLEAPPFCFVEDGETKGFAVDVTREALRRMGERMEFSIKPWKRCLHMVREGQADAVLMAVKNPDREEYMHYPDENLTYEINVAFKRVGDPITIEPDLTGAEELRVGHGSGFSYGPLLDKAIAEKRFKKLDSALFVGRNLEKLIIGRVDIVFGARDTGLHAAKQLGFRDAIEVVRDKNGNETIFTQIKVYAPFSKKTTTPEFVKRFSQSLKSVKDDGTYNDLFDKYR